MLNRKYGTFLTVVLVVVIIIILAIIGKLIYEFFDKKRINDAAEDIIAEFDKHINDADKSSDPNMNGINTTQIQVDLSNFTYGGYNMMGYIEIPAIKIKYPVLEKVTTHSIEIAVAIRAGVGLNNIGNTVIVGHNYRNGLFFSGLNKLKNNDLVYITDRSGTRIKYKVYNIFSTTPEDSSYYSRDTEGRREVSLATCSDTGSMRTVVLAREVLEEEDNVIQIQDVNVNNNTVTNNVTNNENANQNTNENTNSITTNNNQTTINRTEIKPK